MSAFNFDGLSQNVHVWVRQVERVKVAEYRKSVAELFKTLLETTPQSSGRAVANWKIGINAPDLSWDPNEGDRDWIIKDGARAGQRGSTRSMGDPKWIAQAWDQNKMLIRQIKFGDTVFITNSVQGDDDDGNSSEAYLESLQDPSYWREKLRVVNMPYQTVAETLLLHNWGSFADAGATRLEEWV